MNLKKMNNVELSNLNIELLGDIQTLFKNGIGRQDPRAIKLMKLSNAISFEIKSREENDETIVDEIMAKYDDHEYDIYTEIADHVAESIGLKEKK